MPKTLPALMSLADFVQRTDDPKVGFFQKSRQQLRGFENLLEAIEMAAENDLIGLLDHLISHCAEWLKAKSSKNTSLANQRRTVINEVFEQACQRRAYITFEKKKDAAKAKAPAATKALAPSFKNEREAYERIKSDAKEKGIALKDPPAGTAAGWVIKNFQEIPGSLESFFNRLQEDHEFWNRVLIQKKLAELTVEEYEELMKMFGPYLRASFQATEVVYLPKIERLKHMVFVRKGLLFMGADPLNTDPLEPDCAGWLYAVDKYGNLFCGRSKNFEQIVADGVKRLNHSSFNAGKDVIAAGMIYALKGKLKYIDNASGHYQAPRESLVSLIQLLIADQVNMAGVEVGSHQAYSEADRNKFHIEEKSGLHHFKTATDFLAGKNWDIEAQPSHMSRHF